ncbi:MAG: DUF86 domain-containing protein [Burkholderiaceae bacterium]|jgi:uncharacterized protein with HEPN domain|nr:DUF86 domain-containing protein [Burkholderiaceae bacterium]MCU0965060.1 DUF86 domain-containing protein [Burkholderiaceae bacterium]
MTRAPTSFLWDIQQACKAVRDFVRGCDLAGYEANAMVRSAVERQLQNIGEAVSQLSKLDPELAARIPRHRQLVGFRNVLAHGYAGLNNAQVWRVVQENLSELEARVNALIAEHGPPSTP